MRYATKTEIVTCACFVRRNISLRCEDKDRDHIGDNHFSSLLRSGERRAIGVWLKKPARMKPAGTTFFVSERRKPLHRSTVNLALRKYSAAASLSLLAHSHMLHHACGFAIADQGADTQLIQNYLEHRNIQHIVKYTATNPAQFERLWQ
jgi:type 1 fimbriae regulatory protein FimB